MRAVLPLVVSGLLLGGCTDLGLLNGGLFSSEPPAPPQPVIEVRIATADTVKPRPRPARTRVTVPEQPGEIGRSTISLGSPTEPGLWIETPLVTAERPAVATVPETGRSTPVTLRPGPAGGARASLQTLLALGLSPAALAEVVLTAP